MIDVWNNSEGPQTCLSQKIKRTYTVLTDDSARIFRLIEKPKKALNDWQGTGHCVFKNEILIYIERIPIHPERGKGAS